MKSSESSLASEAMTPKELDLRPRFDDYSFTYFGSLGRP